VLAEYALRPLSGLRCGDGYTERLARAAL